MFQNIMPNDELGRKNIFSAEGESGPECRGDALLSASTRCRPWCLDTSIDEVRERDESMKCESLIHFGHVLQIR